MPRRAEARAPHNSGGIAHRCDFPPGRRARSEHHLRNKAPTSIGHFGLLPHRSKVPSMEILVRRALLTNKYNPPGSLDSLQIGNYQNGGLAKFQALQNQQDVLYLEHEEM